MARPKKDDARTIIYKVRLNEEENRILTEASNYASVPRSEVFRSALYNYHRNLRESKEAQGIQPDAESKEAQGIQSEAPVEIKEQELDDALLAVLIRLSADWEAENSCYGYRKNEKADIEGNRIFIAKAGGDVIGYLFGYLEKSERSSSIMPDGTPVFEVEELYVKPEYRSKGIGKKLFSHAEAAVQNDADYIMLSTATKNWRAVFHFYLDELGMEFWSARLFKKVDHDETVV